MIPPEFHSWNMSEATLQRIDSLLNDVAYYRVNDDIYYYYRNLVELWKEAKPHIKHKVSQIKGLTEFYFVTDEEGTKTYNPENLKALEKFDEWVRFRLHREGVTWKKGQKSTRLDNYRKKMDLKK